MQEIPKKSKIVFDLEGSDLSYTEMVAGVELALERGVQAQITLVGTPKAIGYAKFRPVLVAMVRMVECSASTGLPVKIQEVLREPGSSVAVCVKQMKEGNADAMFSCGNTRDAVIWTAAKRGIGMVDGFSLPPLALIVPTSVMQKDASGKVKRDEFGKPKPRQTVLLDAGANVNCTAEQLDEFAWLGRAYALGVLQVPPDKLKIGLLSNGTEPSKGTEITQKAYKMLEGFPWFVGYVEPDAITSGEVDVVVADGYTGNIAFKSTERGAAYLIALLRRLLKANPLIGLLAKVILGSVFKEIRDAMDPRKFGSMPFLGTQPIKDEDGNVISQGIVMIGHGKSDREAVCYGIMNAARYAAMNLPALMEPYLMQMPKPVKQ